MLSTTVYCLVILTMLCCVDGATRFRMKVLRPISDAKCRRRSQIGDTIVLNYNLTVLDSDRQVQKLVSSYEIGEPLRLQLGTNARISSWNDGLLDMCVREKRKLTMRRYGGDEATGVAANSTIVFKAECLAIEDPPRDLFAAIDVNKDDRLSRQEIDGYLNQKLPDILDAATRKHVPEYDQAVEKIFANDLDHDDLISRTEFEKPLRDEL